MQLGNSKRHSYIMSIIIMHADAAFGMLIECSGCMRTKLEGLCVSYLI